MLASCVYVLCAMTIIIEVVFVFVLVLVYEIRLTDKLQMLMCFSVCERAANSLLEMVLSVCRYPPPSKECLIVNEVVLSVY